MRERIQVLEEEKEELKEKEVERRGARQEKEDEEGGGRHEEKDEKGKECVEDTERMLLAVLRELEGIPRYLCLLNVLNVLITSFSKLFSQF